MGFHAEGLEGNGCEHVRVESTEIWHSLMLLTWWMCLGIKVSSLCALLRWHWHWCMYAVRPSYLVNRFQQVGTDRLWGKQKVEAGGGCGLSGPFPMLPELVVWHISLGLATDQSQCE